MSERFNSYAKLIVLGFALLVLLYFLTAVSHLVLLFLLVIVLAMMLNPPVSWLERHRIPRAVGAPLVILVVLGVLVALGFLLLPPLIEQISSAVTTLPASWAHFQQWAGRTLAHYPRVQEMFASNERLLSGAAGHIETVLLQAGKVTVGLVLWFVTAFFIFLLTMFVLIQPRSLLVGFFATVPTSKQAAVARATYTVAKQMRAYLMASLIDGVFNGIVAYVGLRVLHVEPALVLAMLTLLGEFFPYVGPIAAAIPALLLAFLVSPLTAFWVLLLYLAIQQIEANLLAPLILAKQMNFHPLSVAFATLSLGSLFGILGAFLAIPILAITKAFYEELILKPRRPDLAQLERYADQVVEAKPGGKAQHSEQHSP